MIIGLITTLAVGLVAVLLGIINMTGNISSIHEYHRKRVRDEDVKPFGRLVGLGTVIIGVAVIMYGGVLFAFEKTGFVLLAPIGTAVLVIGLIVGLIISFYAMKRYNGGIF